MELNKWISPSLKLSTQFNSTLVSTQIIFAQYNNVCDWLHKFGSYRLSFHCTHWITTTLHALIMEKKPKTISKINSIRGWTLYALITFFQHVDCISVVLYNSLSGSAAFNRLGLFVCCELRHDNTNSTRHFRIARCNVYVCIVLNTYGDGFENRYFQSYFEFLFFFIEKWLFFEIFFI